MKNLFGDEQNIGVYKWPIAVLSLRNYVASMVFLKAAFIGGATGSVQIPFRWQGLKLWREKRPSKNFQAKNTNRRPTARPERTGCS